MPNFHQEFPSHLLKEKLLHGHQLDCATIKPMANGHYAELASMGESL